MSGWLRFDSIRRAIGEVHPQIIVEMGCGEGAIGAWLAAQYRYFGVEPDDQSRAVCSERLVLVGAGRVAGDAGALGVSSASGDGRGGGHRADAILAPGSADLVCAFEVLEHIDDDRGALCEWREQLVERGSLLLSVPAHPQKFGRADRRVGHFRRYAKADLTHRIEAAGYEVLWCVSYGAGLGHILDFVREILARRAGMSDRDEAMSTAASGRMYQPRSALAVQIYRGLALPFRWLQRPFARTNFGTGWVVLAQRAS